MTTVCRVCGSDLRVINARTFTYMTEMRLPPDTDALAFCPRGCSDMAGDTVARGFDGTTVVKRV